MPADRTDTRHARLLQRDEELGLRARVSNLEWQMSRVSAQFEQARRDLVALRTSRRWRVGGLVTAPARLMRSVSRRRKRRRV